MLTDKYFGSYERFSTPSKKEAATLLGADNLIGDHYDIVFKTQDHKSIAWLRNRFGEDIGYFNDAVSRRLSIMAARGWKLNAFLSFAAYSDLPDPGEYWGEMALICYDSSIDSFMDTFINEYSQQLAKEQRLALNLNENELRHIQESNGRWLPTTAIKLAKLEKGSAYIKTKRSFTEGMIEHGRKGNIGCYIVSWLFIFGMVAAVILGLKSCGLF